MDITEWISDPSKLGTTAVLLLVIGMLLRGTLVTSGAVAAIKEGYDARLKDIAQGYDTRIAELTKDRDDYKQMVREALSVTRRTLDAAGVPRKETL